METSLRMPQIQSNRPVLLTAVYKHSRARCCVILKPYSAWHLAASQRILVKLDIGKSSPVLAYWVNGWLSLKKNLSAEGEQYWINLCNLQRAWVVICKWSSLKWACTASACAVIFFPSHWNNTLATSQTLSSKRLCCLWPGMGAKTNRGRSELSGRPKGREVALALKHSFPPPPPFCLRHQNKRADTRVPMTLVYYQDWVVHIPLGCVVQSAASPGNFSS